MTTDERPAADRHTRLSITRERGQKVFLGPDIVVEVVWASGGACRLRITAPASLPVWRAEIAPGTWIDPSQPREVRTDG